MRIFWRALVKDESRNTRLADIDFVEVDRQMGVLELITPYLREANDERERLEQAVEEISARAISKKIVVLSEDENNDLLDCLIRSSGVTDFEILPYRGCDNVSSAFGMVPIIHEKAPDAQIIIHRDRDYLSVDEIQRIEARAERINCTMFITTGTDLESHFLNPKYIAAVSGISIKKALSYIELATKNVRRKSLDKFSAAIMNSKSRRDQGWNISKLEKKYDQNPIRFRHGKSVLREVKRIFHKKTGQNLVLGEEHESLAIAQIRKVQQTI